MEGQTSFLTPHEARERDLSEATIDDEPLFVDDILAVADEESDVPLAEVAEGQLALEIGSTMLDETVEDPR